MLAKEIPNGKIYAVDNDVNMIDKAKIICLNLKM
jgi:predicted O-methyltransferase YrrM